MFYEVKDHYFIINRRIIYFLEHVRIKYFLDTQDLNKDFIRNLHLKSGVAETTCEVLINWINNHQQKRFNSETALEQFNRLLEQFKKEEKEL